jgi:hypothetical protein
MPQPRAIFPDWHRSPEQRNYSVLISLYLCIRKDPNPDSFPLSLPGDAVTVNNHIFIS